jgi:hypothetical protein
MAMTCLSCASRIEEGRKGRPPVEAKFCLKCRAERRRRAKVKYNWLPQHDAYMRAHYHGGLHQRGRVIKELMRQTGFPRWFIKRQAQHLGLTMHPDRRSWTPYEMETLDKLLGKVSAATIAKRVQRTETSVVMKIKALGHSRRVTEGYTIRDLELCFGEDHHKIQKWVASGWLRDGLQGTRRYNGNDHDIHRIREREVLNFIKAYPQEINLGKVDQMWFLDLLVLKGNGLHEASVSRDASDRSENSDEI